MPAGLRSTLRLPLRPDVRRAAFAAVLALALALAGGAYADGPAFLADVDDLPLPRGLVEDPTARVAFEQPGGRVVEAAASGEIAPGAVTDFYRETLPALGWTAIGPGVWQRDGEVLRVAVVTPGPSVRVEFTIAPDAR